MPVDWVTYSSSVHERDMLSILMDSNLYFELSLEERRVLLNRIVASYRSPAISAAASPIQMEKGTALHHPALSLDTQSETL